ncbi:MAG: DEAD/DEAH box helicase, partial [Acidimicrobiia bacterium]
GLGVDLDPYQRRAFDALDDDTSVLVAAPTGSGKTLVAEYAVQRALAAGRKVFYTTPLKALSNQKYGDFARIYGHANVGLLTGDNSVNSEAPIVVMTTEVLRNMIYAGSATLTDLMYVVLDEVHYLQNRYRGAVWEEVIIHLPPDVGLVCLSATVSNAEELADWIATVRGHMTAVIEEQRPVELTNLYAVAERHQPEIHLLPTFVPGTGTELRPNPEAARLDARGSARDRDRGRPRTRLATPRRAELVGTLQEQSMLPAIAFIFSRAACDDAVRQCLAAGLRLTNAEERAALRAIADVHTAALDDHDLAALGYDDWISGFELGIAAHHAGLVPPLKEAVEEAFAAGLVKVVFATETLSLGINMPARTVVIEKLSKFTGEHHEFLTPGEYTQLTGRAGRRGIDPVGFAVTCWSPFVPFEQVAGLASRRTSALTSSFRPTYNMATNLVARYSRETAERLLSLSFAQYTTDRDVVRAERHVAHNERQIEKFSAAARCDRGDLVEYRELLREVEEARRSVDRSGRTEAAIEGLRPGDIVTTRRKGGRAVVLKHESGRSGGRLMMLGPSREVFRLGPRDFRLPPTRVAHIELPKPFAPRSVTFRRAAADALVHARLRDPEPRTDTRLQDREAALAEHAAGGCPQLGAHLKAAIAADRLEQDTARLRRRTRGRSESLTRQFEQVLGVLEALHYVDGWQLTPDGGMLARMYSESDLLIAEALRRGVFDELDPAELASLMSCFTYERRGPDSGQPIAPPVWPTSRVSQRARSLDQAWRELHGLEQHHGLPETRRPDPGLTDAMHAWATGESLADVLDEDDELTGGDFVRHVKQVVDLLRQLGDAAPSPETRVIANQAADACFRGVVAASSVVPA